MAGLTKAFLLLLLCDHTAIAEPVITVRQGENQHVSYRGSASDSIEHFQNIRFAHDTSGARRFAPPELYTPPWGTEIDATSPGPACPQIKDAMPPFFAETKDMSEDCLNLRISRPAGTKPDAKLPVVVWLHGGGVIKGSAYDSHFEPDNIIKLSKSLGKPIIYVALNYRLTIFGFARLPILKDQLSLNVGMRDQRAGFQWIKDNIHSFGGDPSRITAYGLSAGGTFSSMHLMSYGGERGVPFTQLWAMSGPPGTALNMSSDATELHTHAVAKDVGCKQEEEAGLLRCLREVPMQTLLDAAMQYSIANHPPVGTFTFIPSIDGDMFPERPSELYKDGRFVKGIPSVFGWTQDDGAMNAGPAHLIRTDDDAISVIKGFAHAVDKADFSKIFEVYDVADFEVDVANYEAAKEEDDPGVSAHYFHLSRILRDLLFTCSSIDFASEIHKQSIALDPNFPGVRLYTLNQTMYTPLWKGAGMPYLGVSHGSDTNYIFDGLFPEGTVSSEDKRLSNEVTEAFINFAYTGNPNSDNLEHWPQALTDESFSVERSTLHDLHIQVIGGPFGTGAAIVQSSGSDLDSEKSFMVGHGDYQHVLQGYQMGSMSSAAAMVRSQRLASERLFDRCAVIISLAEKLGV